MSGDKHLPGSMSKVIVTSRVVEKCNKCSASARRLYLHNLFCKSYTINPVKFLVSLDVELESQKTITST